MVIVVGVQEAIEKLSDAEVAFVGRLTQVTTNLSVCSNPPVNHYTLKFEKEFQILKGSIGTIYEYHYEQKLRPEQISTIDLKVPHEDQFYVAILHNEDNTINILVEINENDFPLFQSMKS